MSIKKYKFYDLKTTNIFWFESIQKMSTRKSTNLWYIFIYSKYIFSPMNIISTNTNYDTYSNIFSYMNKYNNNN